MDRDMTATRILIDTDPGVDDAMAILLALASPELEIAGITTVFGNSRNVALLTQNACALLELAKRTGIPVAMGAEGPLLEANKRSLSNIHGSNGLGDAVLPAPQIRPLEMTAAEFIVQTCVSNAHDITLITIGPLTNIALALRLQPDLPSIAKAIVIMGGAVSTPGNVTPVVEANVYDDPEAAKIVLNAGWQVTLASLDITHQVALDQLYLESLRQLGNQAGQFLFEATRPYLKTYLDLGRPGMYAHDVHAVMALLFPQIYTSRHAYVDVETAGTLTRGQTIGDWRGQYGKPANAHILSEVDAGKFKSYLKERLARLP
jgi:inosine-uridine nucleoside N-ribohydrolase